MLASKRINHLSKYVTNSGPHAPLLDWSPSQEQPLSRVQLYGTEEGWARLRQEFSLEEHRQIAEGLGDVARQVRAYWLLRRPAPQ